jgi:hypothetical protein
MAVLVDQVAAHDAEIGHAVGDVLGYVIVADEQQLEVEVTAGGEEPLAIAVEFEPDVVQQVGTALA